MKQRLDQTESFKNSETREAYFDKLFVEIDGDKNGLVDRDELKEFLKALFKTYHISTPFTDSYSDSLFSLIDENNDGEIDLQEIKDFFEEFNIKLSESTTE